jgi:hypothetical protein
LADVYDYVNELRQIGTSSACRESPSVFPPRREVAEGHLPYPLRVPAAHHTVSHYSRVWNFDAVGENEWLEGAEGIEALIALRPAELKVVAVGAQNGRARWSRRKKETKRKPRVCVDLDGVLQNMKAGAAPTRSARRLPGALEFATSLSQIADIVIFTTRCSQEHYGDHSTTTLVSPGRLKIRIIDWLEKYNFPYAESTSARENPRPRFIDDRAVNCSPQKDPDAFDKALAAAGALVNPRSADS